MGLKEKGLKIVKRPISNFLPIDDTNYLKLGGGEKRTQEEFRKFSAKDAQRLPEYYQRIEAVADVLRDISTKKTPPNPKKVYVPLCKQHCNYGQQYVGAISYIKIFMICLPKALTISRQLV